MFITLSCFVFAFLLQGMTAAVVVSHFQNLSEKRQQHNITEFEKWVQGFIGAVAKPVLEAILKKDPVGVRVIVTACLLISSGMAFFFSPTPDGTGCLVGLTVILLAATWLSLRV